MKFYHFNTNESLNNSDLDSSDIAFCKETKTIRTNGRDYLSFEWSEIPSPSQPIVSGNKLIINESAKVNDGVCIFDDQYTVSDSTLIIS